MDGLNHSLWVEKYRPQDLSTYIGNEHLKSKVGIYLESEDVPHLLLYGRAGTGKTTLAKIVVKNIDCDYLYINASDENSVDAVRFKIRAFASTIGFKELKVIILDEADYLTPNAQAALRNVMETFSRHCRFILTCNYVERIIDPIQSRCQSFKIIPPKRVDVARHLVHILEEEGIIEIFSEEEWEPVEENEIYEEVLEDYEREVLEEHEEEVYEEGYKFIKDNI